MSNTLDKPPVSTPWVDVKTGKPTSQIVGWFLRLYNRVGSATGGFALNDATYITQTPNSDLINEQALSLLSTGFVKVTTGSGILSSTGSNQIQASDLANTSVVAGSYTVNGATSYTVDAQGRLISASSPVITITGTADKIDVSGGTGSTPTITIATTYLGQTSITTLGTITTGTWNATTIAATVGGTGLTSYTLGDTLYSSASNTLAKLAGNTTTTKKFLTQTGDGANSAAPAWNTIVAGDINGLGQALTRVDDTNVTLTLGGSPSTALLNAASITAGWAGQLAVTRGGTGLSSLNQGDIIYGSASNTFSALAKNTSSTRYLSNTGSSNNPAWAQVDLSNGVTGTLPVANGGSGVTVIPSFSAYNSSATTCTASTSTKVAFQTENWDTGSYFDSSTNYRWTPLVAGTYKISGHILLGSSANIVNGTQYALALYKNGSLYKYLDATGNVEVATTCNLRGSCLVQLNGSTDYVELYVFNGNAVNSVPTNAVANTCYFDGNWVGP